MNATALRRIARREMHSPRTAAMIVAVLLVIALLVAIVVEVVLFATGQSQVLVHADVVARWLRDLPAAGPAVSILGIGVALLGIVFVVLSLSPGRRAKHRLVLDDRLVIIDDGVVAAAIAQRLSEQTGLARDAIVVGVSRRRIEVSARQSLLVSIDTQSLRRAADAALSEYQLSPSVRTSVRVLRQPQKDLDQ